MLAQRWRGSGPAAQGIRERFQQRPEKRSIGFGTDVALGKAELGSFNENGG
jgi:hypothetical protein